MLFLVLGLLGVGAAGAAVAASGGGGGGGSEETPAKKPEIIAPAPETSKVAKPITPDPVVDDTSDDMGHDDDMTHDDHDDMGHDDDMTHDDHDDMGHDDDMTHDDHDDMGHDDDMTYDDHDDMGHDHTPVALPTTQKEIDAFVAALRAAPESHSHDHGSAKAGEHMAAMDLVPRDEATHIAIGHGDWDDPSNWHNGEVPGDNAKVLIPEGVHMTYDHVSDARLFTLRIDGKLEFATDVNSQMIVDTIVTTPGSSLQIGTATDPVAPNVTVDIIFANNGAIDTNWDPMLLSRGMVAHGNVEIHGTVKDSHAKVIDDPMAGDTWVDMGEIPEGWAVGDKIVIAGTHYSGHSRSVDVPYSPPEDEIRIITDISDGLIFFDEPLEHDHDTPRADLKTSVANYTRNISFETEDAHLAEIYERGHVMFMHNDDVDVRYAEFHELGRTDKSEPARNVSEFESIDFDSNVKGRYSFHFHRAGVDDPDDPGMSVGNAVFGSPGWGFVHHDSHAIFDNNATYDTFGAGYIAESGNETGAWTNNIAIFAEGSSWSDPKLGNDVLKFDLATTGDGFWFQSRMVDSIDNIAASVNNGFVYFHRGPFGEDGQIRFDAEVSDIPGILRYGDALKPDAHPILSFSGNEAQAANKGLYVVKANADQGHDVHTVLDDFTAWNVYNGAEISYTSHYIVKDFDVISAEDAKSNVGIAFGANTSDITVIDAQVDGFHTGIILGKKFTSDDPPEDNQFVLINPMLENIRKLDIGQYNPELDTIISYEDIPYLKPDLKLDGPLVHTDGETVITGTKTDSLGEITFPTGADDFSLNFTRQREMLEEEGYYTTSDDKAYMMLDLYFSDRLTGDIYMEAHPVFLGDSIKREFFEFNGVQDLGGQDDPTIDDAILWATLTDGQMVLTDEAIAMEEEDSEEADPGLL